MLSPQLLVLIRVRTVAKRSSTTEEPESKEQWNRRILNMEHQNIEY